MVASSAVRLYLIYLDGYFNLEFEFHPLHYINLGWGIMVCYKLGGGGGEMLHECYLVIQLSVLSVSLPHCRLLSEGQSERSPSTQVYGCV